MAKQSILVILLLVCLVGSILSSYLANKPVSTKAVSEEISQNLADLVEKVNAESAKVIEELRAGNHLNSSSLSFVVIKNDSIIDWNDNHFIPPAPALMGAFDLKFHKPGVGEFLYKKWTIDNNRDLIAIIPLHIQYKITNNYLAPYWNEHVFPIQNLQLVESTDARGEVVFFNQRAIFKVVVFPNSSFTENYWSGITNVLGSLGLIVFFMLLFIRSRSIAERYPDLTFLLLVAVVFGVRVAMILIEFPSGFTNSPLFNPRNFASSELNPSLGDLLLNCMGLLMVCFYLFRNYYKFRFFQFLLSRQTFSFLSSTLCVVLVLFGVLYPFVVTQTIYNNSTITLSISQSIHFDSLRIVALLTVILSWISSFFFMHVFLRILAHERKLLSLLLSIALGCLIFIEINQLTGQNYFWSFTFGVFYIVCVISFKLSKSLQKFKYRTFSYFFVTVLFLTLNGMYAVRYFEQQVGMRDQFRFAGNFLDERDYFAEYLLHEATGRISSDVFIQTRMMSPFFKKDAVIQKIKQIYLSGYFNRYAVDVFLFNASGEPLESADSTSFSSLINRFAAESFRTEYEGVYYVSNLTESDFSRKYVVLVPLIRGDTRAGYVVIELLLKRIIPENVYPELLVDNRFQQNLKTRVLSYAVTQDRHILYSSGDFNYESFVRDNLGDPRLYGKGLVREGYFHVAVEDINGKISIISSREAPLIYWLADFSFQVILGMAMILILLIVQGLYNVAKSQKLYLAARIQLILNLAFFLPLITVSVITLNLTTKSSQEQLNAEFLNKAHRFGEIASQALHENPDRNDFEREFTKLTTLANLDANVFNPDGRLLATTQPLVFENNLLAPYIKRSAYNRVVHGDKTFVSNERVGNLQFYVAYSALLKPDTGERLGILTVPFFQSASSLERMQITILANILSIFTLVFIVLLTVSFLVTKWLTAPLRVITKTLGHISLTGTNKPLQWQSDDEIGLMAKEYNQMLLNLNSSKKELERNQRESAWREIAQQVAHEIKNPLTPMKLTLQQLERTILQENQQDSKLSKAVGSLLSQVNSLDDIASSFSSFAKMPEPVMSEVELISLLTKTINLHNQEGRIIFQPTQKKAWVLADSQLLGRIFSNLILNGLQAARPGVAPIIQVNLNANETNYQMSFSDNGRGIEAGLIDKIFLPHFTTKQSGSGLGLAISKQGIEQMMGKIWFETSIQGTTFTIELPRQA